ncbi:hypothetical protein HF888_12665 [Bermanella marisrubri]|uniref:Uncharacterized protein n=1 Tax=Bermanella marisrubri TaxID=207949 RepID=Q1MZW6_9GAMM|nr:hypothetical protein [Bermanella marisrubri]EAT11441.1 hypothetical protein RED65_04520 [Oceanobacter sp. RED65] [Bermanella marisrubri]QIZ85019.1 hypothetical protein HF888_12665 [Bermanella marisrubri]
MKQTFALIFLMGVIGFIVLMPHQQNSTSDWSDWIEKTTTLFEDSGKLFKDIGQDAQDEMEPSPSITPAKDDVDEQLQALLPPERLDLKVDPMTLDDSAIPLETAAEQHQFSNLFEPRVKDQKPAFKGKLHTDENNEIIGAEMHLAIPTN